MTYVVGLAIYHSLRSCHCVNLEYNTGPQPAHEKTNNGNKWQIELDVDINIRFSDISMSDLTTSGINLWWPDFTMIDKFAKALVNCDTSGPVTKREKKNEFSCNSGYADGIKSPSGDQRSISMLVLQTN